MGKSAIPIPWDDLTKVCKSLQQEGRWHDLLFITLPRVSGFRVSDWSAATWGDILNPDGSVRNSFRCIEKKRGTDRTTPFSEETRSIIALCRDNIIRWKDIAANNPAGFSSMSLFPTRNGKKKGSLTAQGVNFKIKGILTRYEIPRANEYSSHSLRKSYSIQLFNGYAAKYGEEHAITCLQHLLMHKSRLTTMIYLGIFQRHLSIAPEMLNIGIQ